MGCPAGSPPRARSPRVGSGAARTGGGPGGGGGAALPVLLILAGVIGGLLAFGLVGLFIGPVILAVAYTLLVAWVTAGDSLGRLSSSAPSAPLTTTQRAARSFTP